MRVRCDVSVIQRTQHQTALWAWDEARGITSPRAVRAHGERVARRHGAGALAEERGLGDEVGGERREEVVVRGEEHLGR